WFGTTPTVQDDFAWVIEAIVALFPLTLTLQDVVRRLRRYPPVPATRQAGTGVAYDRPSLSVPGRTVNKALRLWSVPLRISDALRRTEAQSVSSSLPTAAG